MALQGKNGGALGYVGNGLERAIEEYLQQIRDVPEKISTLITKLNRNIAVMKDAEQKTISSHEVRFWLQNSKQILLDAEDLFDELATDAAVQGMSCLPLFPAIPTVTRAMRRRIKRVNDRLDLLASETPHRISAAPVSCTRLTWRQTSSLLPDAASVIGRDSEKEDIIKILLPSADPVAESSNNNNKSFFIVPIVGLGGVGKTTLARLIFNDQNVKKHFELMMWVCVSNDPDHVRLTKEMIEAAFAYRGKHETCNITNWDSMQRILLKEVEGKTFFLVLDDVWDASDSMWEELFKPLHSGKKGSKVLVTSRNRAFVNKLGGRMETPIHLGGLSDANIWDVCKNYALKGNIDSDGTTSAEYSHLQVLGSRIVQKLKGSPLAARTIGSLLNRELSEQHWKTVLESEFWNLKQGEEDILPALLLSYQYLPPDLKQCFAYCSLFPKDHKFSREEIVQLWEAQSFIRKDRGTRMGTETMGSKYFEELLHMSFIESKSGHDGDYYVMHDLIHDLAEYVSSDDCFRLEDQKLGETPDTTVRHVSLWYTDQIDITENEFCRHEKLRTLLLVPFYNFHLDTNDLDQLFLKLKRLRVLRLSKCGIRELPGSLGDLKHLRYLDLRGNDHLERLPESLGNLYNLQVLNLYGCDTLDVLPSTMSQLVNLKHLQLEDRGLLSTIDGVGKLTGLQELQVRGRQLIELGGMRLLRELRITNVEEVGSKEEAIQTRLHTMERLQVLQLEWSDRGPWSMNPDSMKPELEEEVLEALRPNKGIRELHIQGYGGSKSPDWMEVPTLLSSFSSLRRVSLSECPNWQVPPCSFLGQLRYLEYLEIKQMPEWEEWSCPVSWDCLQHLTIRDCPRLKELPLLPWALRRLHLEKVGISCLHSELDECSRVDGRIETTSSPYSPPTSAALSRLYISSCDNLTSISGLLLLPDLLEIKISKCENLVSLPEKGFGHLVSLKRLMITECPKLTFLLPMQKEEEDAQSQHLPCSLEELEINLCGDAMGGWWWAGLQRLTSIAKLSLKGCPTTIELLFDRLGRHHHPHLPATLIKLLIDGYNSFDDDQQSTTSSACSSQLSPPPTLPPIPHNNVDASAGVLRAFTSLKVLTIQHYPNFLQKWGGCGLPSSLEQLTVDGDRDLSHEDLSAWLHNLISLKQLALWHLENLSTLPDLSGLPSLETLKISFCPSINTLEVMSIPTSLKSLGLENLENLHSLPDLSGLPSLETLHIYCCPSINTWEVSLPTSLKSLTLQHLENFHSLPATLRELLIDAYFCKFDQWQQSATSSACSSQLSPSPTLPPIPHSNVDASAGILRPFTSLTGLIIRHCPNFLQKWVGCGPPSSLERLTVVGDDDSSLEDLTVWWHNLISPQYLTLENVSALPDLSGLSSLETLKISSYPSIKTLEGTSLPTSLQSLTLMYLKNLHSLPDLSGLPSLETLHIYGCPSIQSWPSSGLPSSLSHLQIIECPALTGRHKDKPKSMWPEVAHIPHVMIDLDTLD